jgi:hypothetical protein
MDIRRSLKALPVLAVVAIAVPVGSASAKGKPKPRPNGADLVIKSIQVRELPGVPPYIAVDEADRAPSFVINVVTKNVGKRKASTR